MQKLLALLKEHLPKILKYGFKAILYALPLLHMVVVLPSVSPLHLVLPLTLLALDGAVAQYLQLREEQEEASKEDAESTQD